MSLPSPDDEFDHFQANFYAQLILLLPVLNLAPGELDAVTATKGNWEVVYPEHLAAQLAAQTKTQAKSTSRKNYNAALQAFIARLQTNPNLTDEMRVLLGIAVRATTRSKAPAMTTIPELEIFLAKLQHILHFHDQGKKRGSAKPKKAKGCEIFMLILPQGTAAPTDPTAFQFLVLDTASPYEIKFKAADAGKVAYYVARWVNTADEPGGWSEIFSATIAGV